MQKLNVRLITLVVEAFFLNKKKTNHDNCVAINVNYFLRTNLELPNCIFKIYLTPHN